MIKNIPELDPSFIPLESYFRDHLKTAEIPIAIGIFRENSQISVFHTLIHGTEVKLGEDCLFIEKIVKFLIWSEGAWKVVIYGSKLLADYLSKQYQVGGIREFDYRFMSKVYGKEFCIESGELKDVPAPMQQHKSVGRNLEGCRIGFDAGGSDRKVSAVIDGQTVYSEEVLWLPKENSNPEYHFQGILESFRAAASKMPRVDAIGVSSAGIYIENKTKVASLFLQVEEKDFHDKVEDIYIRAAKEIGNVPLEVANDGDVTALAGAMSLQDTDILGIAMGTSQAVGYVDGSGSITGKINELAFAPVDLSPEGPIDEWSGDRGVGCKYFSQDAVIRLAHMVGVDLSRETSLASKLKRVQQLMEEGDSRAESIFNTIGCYLGHTIPLYARFYSLKHLLILGRVTSGLGGEIILTRAKAVIDEEYPEFSHVNIQLPDENTRRVGQSIAAASLPSLGGKTL